MAEAFLVQRIAGGGKDIGQAEVQLDFTSVTYNKSSHEPKVQSVTYNGAELVALQDYVVYSAAYTDAGAYNIVVSGIGDYSGAKEVAWTIEQAQGSISVEPSSVSISGALGSTTTAKLNIVGDGEVTFGESDYVSLSRSGTTLTVKAVAKGSGTVDIILLDGRNYKGAQCTLNVQVDTYDPVFENNTWEQIAKACKDGVASKVWTVGDRKAFTINDETYHFQIGAFDHDNLDTSDPYYSDAGYNNGKRKAAITLIMEEIYSTEQQMHSTRANDLGWHRTDMLNTIIPTIKSSIEPDLISVIRTVLKSTAQSGSNSMIIGTVNDLFLMSEKEVLGSNTNSAPNEGTQYDIFSKGGSVVKNRNGLKDDYWLRSPYNGYTMYFLYINYLGNCKYAAVNNKEGVVLCCCI